MKRVYLHLGFHKTASSSFQDTCKQNRRAIAKQGVTYPLYKTNVNWRSVISNHSMLFCSPFLENPEKYQLNVMHNIKNVDALNKHYLKIIEQHVTSKANIIFSGEGISTLPENALKDLSNFLAKFDCEVIPFALVRSPYDYHCSALQQRIKSGQYRDFGRYISQVNTIKRLKKAFDNVQFIPFREACGHHGGPVQFIFDFMNIDTKGFKFINKNEGASNDLVRIQNEINKQSPLFDGNLNINADWINVRALKLPTHNEKFLYTKEEYNLIQQKCELDNQSFTELLGVQFTDKEIKFSKPNHTYNELAMKIITNKTTRPKHYLTSLLKRALKR